METTASISRYAPGLEPLLRPICELRQDPDNARSHDERNLAAIRDSLTRFGLQKPIVVSPDNIVIAGNGTLQAARDLGWTHIACVTTDLAGLDARGFALADNRSAELATWDMEALRKATSELEAVWGDLSAMGFGDTDLDAIARELNRQARAGFGGDKPITVAVRPDNVDSTPGTIYELGPHRLLCGDSTDPEQVARLFEDGAKVALFATDPPYLIGYRGGVGTSPGGRKDWSALSPDPTALDPATAPAARSGHRRRPAVQWIVRNARGSRNVLVHGRRSFEPVPEQLLLRLSPARQATGGRSVLGVLPTCQSRTRADEVPRPRIDSVQPVEGCST